MLRLAGSILAAAVLLTVATAEYDNFNIVRDHPLCSYSQESCNAPVVLSKFHFIEDDGDLFVGDNAYFIPGTATYRKAGSSVHKYSDVDAFVVKRMFKSKVCECKVSSSGKLFCSIENDLLFNGAPTLPWQKCCRKAATCQAI